jgi:transcriptional regulator of arginine metabolism
MKNQRQKKILELIAKYEIETQDELTNLLCNNGFNATQATVSRDIKELRLVKISTGSDASSNVKYKYAENNLSGEIDTRLGGRFKNILSDTVISVKCASNIVVLKTYAGMAQGAGAVIDALDVPTLIGSVAGDDTVIIIMASDSDAVDFSKKLAKSIKS